MGVIATESVAGLHQRYGGPFVRTRLTAANTKHVWRLGGAVVVEQSHDRHGQPVTAPQLFCLGDPADLKPLLTEVARTLPAQPERLSVEAHAEAALPRHWRFAQANRWTSMWTGATPPRVPHEDDVEPVIDTDEVDALLDAANPGSHGRPGDPGMRTWLGVRRQGDLVAAGALTENPGTGTPNLRGITTLAHLRGRGLATAVTARLTRLGLETLGPVVTLGVYTANEAAISVYRRLGYQHDRSFVSGPLQP
ncbi:MAG: GNAT family N-acetyltransferase [Actinomycetota bacterium]|nr:GNAT family N-acetyltransferase [Actinomycetota bacterium]